MDSADGWNAQKDAQGHDEMHACGHAHADIAFGPEWCLLLLVRAERTQALASGTRTGRGGQRHQKKRKTEKKFEKEKTTAKRQS